MFFHILDKAAVGISEREIMWNIHIRVKVNSKLAEVFPNRIILIMTNIEYIMETVWSAQ